MAHLEEELDQSIGGNAPKLSTGIHKQAAYQHADTSFLGGRDNEDDPNQSRQTTVIMRIDDEDDEDDVQIIREPSS